MTAAVRLETVTWGTKIELICAYPKASPQYPAGTAYSLVVTDGFGNRQQIATWSGVAGRTLTVPAATSLKDSMLSRVELRRTDDGKVLLAGSP
jgi:hypothetical protein